MPVDAATLTDTQLAAMAADYAARADSAWRRYLRAPVGCARQGYGRAYVAAADSRDTYMAHLRARGLPARPI